MFNKRLFSLGITLGLILGLVSLAMAGVPDPGQSTVATNGGEATITPGGLAAALNSYGVTINVTIRDNGGLPIPAYPRADIWFDDNGSGDLNMCQNGSRADLDTDAAGAATIGGAVMFGGGWTQAGVSVYVSGVQITGGMGPNLGIDINSPDITNNGVVDGGDLAPFSVDINDPSAPFESDFTHDGLVDLGDLSLFSGWIEYAPTGRTDRCP
jgi:hypothetical protein